MIEFDVQAMSCGHCVSAVSQTIKAMDPAARVEVDLANKKVKIESEESPARLAQALAEAGYPPA